LDQALRLLHPIMPYVTEEIWQEVKSRQNLAADSIMISEFPTSDEALMDEASDQEITWIKDFTLAVRQIRGEMNIPPSKNLTVLLNQTSEFDLHCLDKHQDLLKTMARLDQVNQLTDGQEEPPSATALMGEMKILIPLAGLIDKAEETKRINKQIDKIKQEIKRGTGKLNNEKFTNKAPEHLVQTERDKLQANQNTLTELEQQLEKLKMM